MAPPKYAPATDNTLYRLTILRRQVLQKILESISFPLSHLK